MPSPHGELYDAVIVMVDKLAPNALSSFIDEISWEHGQYAMIIMEFIIEECENNKSNHWCVRWREDVGIMDVRHVVYHKMTPSILVVYKFFAALRDITRDNFVFSYDYDVVEIYMRELTMMSVDMSTAANLGILRADWKERCWKMFIASVCDETRTEGKLRSTWAAQRAVEGNEFNKKFALDYPEIWDREYGMQVTEM